MFKIGDRVKCINSGGSNLILNEIYTITSTRKNFTMTDRTVYYVNNTKYAYDEWHFDFDIKYNRKEKLERICLKSEIT